MGRKTWNVEHMTTRLENAYYVSPGGRCIDERRPLRRLRLRDTNSVISRRSRNLSPRRILFLDWNKAHEHDGWGIVHVGSPLAARQCRLLFPVARDQPLDSIRVAEMLMSDRNAPLVHLRRRFVDRQTLRFFLLLWNFKFSSCVRI